MEEINAPAVFHGTCANTHISKLERHSNTGGSKPKHHRTENSQAKMNDEKIYTKL